MRVDRCSAFEPWLIVERCRVSAAIEARLREVALGLLADGRAVEAVDYASRLVARNRFGEDGHELSCDVSRRRATRRLRSSRSPWPRTCCDTNSA
ncbi:MAG: hypothetical protein R2715_15810 [Ilumatobacteraceae bacterium]